MDTKAIHFAADSATCNYPEFLGQAADRLGAFHLPDPAAALKNLDADADRVRAYLGTYFPRTVVEFRTIGRELLAHPAFRKSIRQDKPLRILDLGSGTGGAWIGFLLACCDHGLEQRLEVVAIDGNEHALNVQNALLPDLAAGTGAEIGLAIVPARLRSDRAGFAADLASCLEPCMPSGSAGFDLVLVSKHFSEHYQAEGTAAYGVVADGLEILGGCLAPQGALIMLDVTNPIEPTGQYMSFRLAQETVDYLSRRNARLHPVLPVPCALHAGRGCAASTGCFTQRRLDVHHVGKGLCDSTKITYRVFCEYGFAQQMLHDVDTEMAYSVNAARPQESCQCGRKVSVLPSRNGFVFPQMRSAA
jgi:SAM-dependent methyltransferase